MRNRKKLVLLYGLVLGMVVFLGAGPLSADKALRATLNVVAYGYQVEVTVNGTRLNSVKGGKSEATQLFAVDHPMRSKAAPPFKNNFVLKTGKNSITIKYIQTDKNKPNPPLFSLFSPSYSSDDPIFRFEPKQAGSGSIDQEFEIFIRQPEGFKTKTL